jgi:hypothetical protein
MIVLGLDPGQESPGYAVWDSDQRRHLYVGATCPDYTEVHAVVVESGFIGRIGKLGMWGLGFGAGWRLHEASCLLFGVNTEAPPPCFSIRPDGATGWRAALPAREGLHKQLDGLPKDVVVARLRVRYQRSAPQGAWDQLPHATDDMIEAMGIAEAAAAILARPKAKDRRALKAVKFG